MKKLFNKLLCATFGHKKVPEFDCEHIIVLASQNIGGFRYVYKIDMCERCISYTESLKMTEEEYAEKYNYLDELMPEHVEHFDEYERDIEEVIREIMGEPLDELGEITLIEIPKKKKMLH